MIKFVSFNTYLKPFEEKAKTCSVTLTNKNKKKLNTIYIQWALNTYGNTFNTLFKAVYFDYIADSMPKNNLISKIEKDSIWNGSSICEFKL